ncbi:unannotated protein [freshwater metagenome]|uniref:Unannotated protein n=1 Tax=freshwater metagenome TaxID=449393 RepID=A0A6J7GJ92_9ZZZZ
MGAFAVGVLPEVAFTPGVLTAGVLTAGVFAAAFVATGRAGDFGVDVAAMVVAVAELRARAVFFTGVTLDCEDSASGLLRRPNNAMRPYVSFTLRPDVSPTHYEDPCQVPCAGK